MWEHGSRSDTHACEFRVRHAPMTRCRPSRARGGGGGSTRVAPGHSKRVSRRAGDCDWHRGRTPTPRAAGRAHSHAGRDSEQHAVVARSPDSAIAWHSILHQLSKAHLRPRPSSSMPHGNGVEAMLPHPRAVLLTALGPHQDHHPSFFPAVSRGPKAIIEKFESGKGAM